MPKQNYEDEQVGEDLQQEKEEDEKIANNDKTLIEQIQSEYDVAWHFTKPKIDTWAIRLKLYNNQRRNKEAIGDPLLFTIHQTVLASLYNDKLAVEFLAREEGDAEVAENLNNLAEFDYDEMMKDEIDYEWDWDAAFFGRGLLLAMEFSRQLKCPCPEVIDPMCWIRDPRAVSVNGDRKGRKAMRFGGREIRLSKAEMRKAEVYSDYQDLKPDNTDSKSLVDENADLRSLAQGTGDVGKMRDLTGENADLRLLEWFTNYKGKKILVTLGDDRKQIIRISEIKRDYWPIIDRPLYPISHDWDGVSIPDLIEDKQRNRAIIQNLALAGIKTGQHPTYLYDTNKIKNRGNLNIDFDKHIPIDGAPDGAIRIVERQQVKQEVQWILDTLDQAAQRATATPDIQQGVQSQEKRTATELNLQSTKVDTRYSLTAKIWGWSEKRFWRMGWYDLYKTHFKDRIDEKVVRITGAMGAKWRKLTRDNIIASVDPDIKIESRVLSEVKKTNDLQKYRLFVKDVMATDPQNSNVRFALRKIGCLSGFSKEDVEQVLPPTVDELTAEDENVKLDGEQRIDVNVYDDDFIHMTVHNRAADNPYKFAHIEAHKKAMMLKRVNPAMDMARNRPQIPEEAGGTAPVKFMKEPAGAYAGVTNM